MASELHLIILWARARYKEKEILTDIAANLKILECYDIAWSKKFVANNFSRFYGVKLDSRSSKEKECGSGRFLLITVLDENPKYDFIKTSRGFENVNTNLFFLKEKYRAWTRGGHRIHATNSVAETNHDLSLLLGKNSADYLLNAPEKWDGSYKKLQQDLLGCHGWKSLEELFYVLNNTITYAVLRNYECLPDKFSTKIHGDIDVLTDDYQNFVFLLNGTKVFNVSYRVHYKCKVNNQVVFWDIRSLGDDYYCKKWQRTMLSQRYLNECNFYVLDNENYFYSLVYHALVHKNKIAADYYEKTERLFNALGLNSKINLADYPSPFDAYFQLLLQFMRDACYFFVRPKDKSVYYNEVVIGFEDIIDYLEKNTFLVRVCPILINHYGGSGYIYFQGYKDNRRLFVKWGGMGDTCKNEFIFSKRFYELNQNYFVKPWFYKMDGKNKCFVMDYVDGRPLDCILRDGNLSQEEKNSLLVQLANILNVLQKSNCLHRDIRPANFIFSNDGFLKLLDNQFCVDTKKYKECRVVRRKPSLIFELGAAYALGKFKWDDAFSIVKIMEEIGVSAQTRDVYVSSQKCVGKFKIVFPHRLYVLTRRKFVRILAKFIPVKSFRKKLKSAF